MRWSDELVLIGTTPAPPDSQGFPTPALETRNAIFANRKSVGYSEFFQAKQAGYTEWLKFDVHSADYAKQELAEYEGKRYTILRTYIDQKSNGEFIELTLSDLSQRGGGNG